MALHKRRFVGVRLERQAGTTHVLKMRDWSFAGQCHEHGTLRLLAFAVRQLDPWRLPSVGALAGDAENRVGGGIVYEGGKQNRDRASAPLNVAMNLDNLFSS